MAIWNARYGRHIDRTPAITMNFGSKTSMSDGKPSSARKLLLYALLLVSFGFLALGCSDSSTSREQMNAMSNDISKLKQLIQLPGDIKNCEWQTGKTATRGEDWWVAAVLEVASGDMSKFLSGAFRNTAANGADLVLCSTDLLARSRADAVESGQISHRNVRDRTLFEITAPERKSDQAIGNKNPRGVVDYLICRSKVHG
jgi:hypothetical protein